MRGFWESSYISGLNGGEEQRGERTYVLVPKKAKSPISCVLSARHQLVFRFLDPTTGPIITYKIMNIEHVLKLGKMERGKCVHGHHDRP
jgi:hypothetical protein